MSSGPDPAAGGRPPTVSIIVPVYNVADYLAECLDSILNQSFAAFEVIAVDDASTDESAALLDAFAVADPRISAVHLDTNVGLGMARNAGMERARGQYLLFVDSDDLLPRGALQAVVERMGGPARPDVVMFGFARSYPDGRVVTDARCAALAPEAALRTEDRPQLLEIMPAAWNKAYRRDFLARHGFRFPGGYYEDVPWTYPVLMAADPVVTLDRVCYVYRQRGGGNILHSSGRRHLDVFDQYDKAFAFIDQHPELAVWRERLFERMTRHIPAILETGERIPAGVRREFFHAAAAAFRRHRPPGYAVSGSAGWKIRLVQRGRYPAFRAAQLANRMRRRLAARVPGQPRGAG